MKIIAVSNQKGGVGKTTTATTLAYGLKLRGKRVLLVDCDPQGNSTDTWRATNKAGSPTLADLLFTNEPAEDCIQHTEMGDILAGDPVLEDAEKHLTGFAGFFKLKKRLEPLLTLYDHIILDTPPNLGILLQNALIAAEGVIVPVTCGRYALQGMGRFVETVNDVNDVNPDLEILGMLLVQYAGRRVLAREVVAGLPDLAGKLGTRVFDTKIRRTEMVEKAQAERVPLQRYAPDATAAVDYATLIDELGKRGVI
jgi:chromosome partitioning protein